jgi:hypothetical protein
MLWRWLFKVILIAVGLALTVATHVQLSSTETNDFRHDVSASG